MDGGSQESLCEVRRQLRELKFDICKQCKKNFELEKDVRYFDQRIALLINHKITVEEFPDSGIGEQRVGNLKDDLQKRCFGNLLFLLQTDPSYLAKLTRSVAPTEIDELLQIVMFSLYGNQYEAREEHLLLKMFELALQMEFDETEDFNNLLRANTAISRMMTAYTRRGPGQEYLKETLQSLIEDIAARKDLNLEVHPVKVYAEIHQIEDDEQNSITMETALRDSKVAEVIRSRLKGLEELSSQFFDAIIQSLDFVPYGIRWLCKAIYQLCREKFPAVPVDSITGLIGGFFMLRFINPAIVSPNNYMLLNSQPRQATRRTFVLVAKLMQSISNGAILKEIYMKPLHNFVKSRQNTLQSFLHQICDVDDFHSYLEIEQYLSLPKDMIITISLKEIYRLHELLCKYQDFLISTDMDKITLLLEELGVPSQSSRVGSNLFIDLPLLSRWDVTTSLRNEPLEFADRSSEHGIKSLRKQCRKILTRLFSTVPLLMQELTLREVLARGEKMDDEEVTRLVALAHSHLDALHASDTLYREDEFYNSIKEKVLQQELQYERMLRELKGLKEVLSTLNWHGNFLSEQLSAYKEYLQAVRNKAAVREANTSSPGKPSRSEDRKRPLQFTYANLEKDRVILESRTVTEKMKSNIYFTVVSPEPGIYKITLHYKSPIPGQSPKMELDLRLEDLLEQQHFRDPVLNLNEFVVLDVRHTLLFLRKHFVPRRL